MAWVAAEQGLRGATAVQVAKRAGVSRAALAQHFTDLDDCFLALLDWLLGRSTTLVADAFEREPAWDDGVLAGLEALLLFLDSEPISARACLLEGMTGLSAGFQSRAQILEQLGQLMDSAARRQLALERQPPATTPEAIVASILGLLRKRLLGGEAPPFVAHLGQLTEVVVAPYFGPSAAAQTARRGNERARVLLRERSAMPSPQEIKVPGMLRHASSHRLRSCLRYLADNPRASNRDVAEGIGISHSGQVSMLLARLHDSDLLVKECGGAGQPNSWCLSRYGTKVARVLYRR
jgi:AcrR family transcriptional regulator